MTIGSFSVHQHQYPDPFLDMASTKLPKSRLKLIELCKIFALTHPQIAPIVSKIAKYPITTLNISSGKKPDKALEAVWKKILEEEVDIYQCLEEFGLDYNGTGNAAYTIVRPFVRLYKCEQCKYEHPANEVKFQIRGKDFIGVCPLCKKSTKFSGTDLPLKGESAMHELAIVILPIEDIIIKQNRLTKKTLYFCDVPSDIKNAIKQGKPDRFLIDSTPWDYIQAGLQGKKIKFEKGVIFHHKTPTISSKDNAYGLPFYLPALKDAYLNQVYKKADETVAQERTVPARFVYPSATSSDPMQTINLSKFSAYMSRAMKRFRYDKNAILPVPFPIGISELGGDAQRLFTSQLRDSVKSEIIGATGMFEGFLSDGMSWSGGSVQLRMLENSLMSYSRAINKFLKNVVQRIASILNIEPVEVTLKPFRTQDDLQLTQILMSLAQMNHVSFDTILSRMDLSWEEEHEKIKSEVNKSQAIDIQKLMLETRAALESASLQVRAGTDTQGYSDINSQIGNYSAALGQNISGQTNDMEQSEQEMADQQAQAESQPSPQDELASAQADNLKATSMAKETGVKEVSKKQDFIDGIAKQMISLSPKDRDKKMEALSENAPDIFAEVKGRMSQIEDGENEVGEKDNAAQSNQAADILKEIRKTSTSPKELAYKIIMLDPELKASVFDVLNQSDPQLGIMVAKEMNGNIMKAKGNGNQVGAAVDMTQMPQAKPPRRKN
jgi:hypothetical protein